MLLYKQMEPLILVVDDDPDFLEIIQAKLLAKGFRTESAQDGSEAVEKAVAISPDLILMDIKMPKKDGVNALLELSGNKITKDIPVIFLTSLGEMEMTELNKKFAKELGAADYFKKNDNYDLLLNRIGRMIKSQ